MDVIYKYQLRGPSPIIVKMPPGAEILCVQNQLEEPTLWVRCDPKVGFVGRKINVFVTGERVGAAPGKYIGTVLLMDGTFVVHVFDGGEVALIPNV
jgi:hypothetical protein